jgi:hypothetical protein
MGVWDGAYERSFHKKFIVRYDVKTHTGFVSRRSQKRAVACALRYQKARRIFLSRFSYATHDYATRWHELCTDTLWNEKLKIADK